MYHGTNYFPAGIGPGSVDLRLWRGRGGRAFTVLCHELSVLRRQVG
ncbi:hypothetical protein [Amycolatopsis sp. NPDC054798]